MKKIISTLLCLILIPSITYAATPIDECEAELFTARQPLQFDLAVKNATKLGITQQVILEATFLYYVDTENYKAIAALHTQFENQLENFNLDDSKIFATKEQWQSVIQYSLALQSLEKKDTVNFKKHITEAYWLSPETASAFSHHITAYRNKKIMTEITIEPDRELLKLENAKPITFQELIKDNDAIVVRFWSPWNQQIDTTYPLIQSAATQCQGKKIAFASVLLENEEQLITNAKELIAEITPTLPCSWLIDSNKNSLSKQLRISNLPTIVIINKNGKIAYHGNASNNSFWKELGKLDDRITKPTNNEPN